MPQAGSSTVSPRRGSVTATMNRTTGRGRVELAGVARRVAHLPQHGLVERAQGVDLLAGGEVDAVDLVDDVAQQVAAHHAVVDARKTVAITSRRSSPLALVSARR